MIAMEKKESDIDPRIWKGNAEFLKDTKNYVKTEDKYYWQEAGKTKQLIDNNESITPTTDKGYLDFGLVIEQLKNLQKEAEIINVEEFAKSNAIFIKKYQYKDSNTSDVVRFGINLKNKDLFTELDNYNTNLNKDLALNPNDAKSNISNETKYKDFSNKYIKLTSFEKLAIQSTIDYLESSTNNIALVDVFKRESKQTVDSQNKKIIIANVGEINPRELDTHTALLYKTIENKILVIDPSNPIFSAHIAKFSDNIVATPTVNDKYKIYTPIGKDTEKGKKLESELKSVTGYSKDQYRDCIDVAVKIAFSLKKDDTQYKKIEEILNSTAIKLITNNKAIDKISSENPIVSNRLKQASDYSKIIESNMKLTSISAIQSDKDKYSLEEFNFATQKVKENYNLQITEHSNEYNTGLMGISDEYSQYIDKGDF